LFPSISRDIGVYTIGRIPEERLLGMGIITKKDKFYIRHPSHGSL